MEHVLVQPARRFEAVVVHGKVCGNQRENLKGAPAHRQVDGVNAVPRNANVAPNGFREFAGCGGELSACPRRPNDVLLGRAKLDVRIAQEFLCGGRKVQCGEHDVPSAVHGSHELEQLTFGPAQSIKRTAYDENARTLGRLALLLSHQTEGRPLLFQIHP